MTGDDVATMGGVVAVSLMLGALAVWRGIEPGDAALASLVAVVFGGVSVGVTR